jgi:hypothetical protein
VAPVIAVIDPEQVRAAVTIAFDATMDTMVEEITTRVLAALTAKRAGERIETRSIEPVPVKTESAPVIAAEPVRPVVRVPSHLSGAAGRQSLRPRSGSVLGLGLSGPELPSPREDSDSD